ncbi:CsbD family protein [Methylorubrum zatmanii]
MNRDQIEGGIRNLKGRGRTALGAVTGRARPQAEGAYEQIAGVAQAAYGRTRERAEELYEDGYRFADEAASRGRHLRDEAVEHGRHLHREARSRGRHLRDEANRRGHALAVRADENRGATLALVAAAAFGLGWLVSRRR